MTPALDGDRALAEKLVDVFLRLVRGDLTARIPRNFREDHEDAIAFFIDVLAEQIGDTQRRERAYEVGMAALIEKFIALASGDFTVRAERTGRGDPLDTMAYMLNNVAVEIGLLVGDHEKQRKLLEMVLESMLDGVLLLDRQGRVHRTNAAMAKLLGRRAKDLVGQRVGELLAPSERALADELSSERVGEAFVNRDTFFRTSEGGTFAVAVNGSPHRDAGGEPVGFVLVARDDRELRQVNAQLHMSDRLATMGTLAAGVAHEINNPLAFVSANIDFVLEEMNAVKAGEPLPPKLVAELRRALSASREGALRVRNIIRDLHHFTRGGEAGTSHLDLNALLEAALNLVQNELRHHARLSKAYGEPPAVHANEGQLLQVFMNLLLNAAQAIPLGSADASEIRITTGAAPNGAFVEIRDTGTGISEEDLPRIFDLFYTTKAIGEGTGMGLSIARRLVEKAGGRLEVESKLGVGSAFRVVLPAAPEQTGATRPASAKKRRSVRRLRVLVVDDELEVGASVRRVLGRTHSVHVAGGAAEAIVRLDKGGYDLVLCDLLMPEMTGMELHERLRETKPNVAERMVFMTAGAFSAKAQQFLGKVPNRRVEKPFDAETLRALVKEVASAR
ncbi:sensor histidine kinase [Labilithrix luteola]|uniref:histidine kinase n=1 Tax=Labilithrix luteola TaxID=1391654 RepID=A0A0K1PJV5_9BACT|nr:ATP-binding protein [Labilithrix luteola]AKU93792.1 sensor histidine kinase [Labilithrix luteola]